MEGCTRSRAEHSGRSGKGYFPERHMWEGHPQQGELLGPAQGMSQLLCVSGSPLSSVEPMQCAFQVAGREKPRTTGGQTSKGPVFSNQELELPRAFLGGFPGASAVKNLPQCRRSSPGSGRSPGGGHLQPTPVSSHGKSHGKRSLVGLQSMGLQRVGHNLKQLSTHAGSFMEGFRGWERD